MKIQHKTDRLNIEVEGEDAKDCFDKIAGAIEVFGNSVCGSCDSSRTVPVVRESKGHTFREMRCLDCGSALAFGQKKADGSLFPKRKGSDDSYLPGNGWTKWAPKEEAF
jgi:hypothetical protein